MLDKLRIIVVSKLYRSHTTDFLVNCILPLYPYKKQLLGWVINNNSYVPLNKNKHVFKQFEKCIYYFLLSFYSEV